MKHIGLIAIGGFAGLLIVSAFPNVFPSNFDNRSLTGFSAGALNSWRAQGGFKTDYDMGSKSTDISYIQSYLLDLYPDLTLKLDGALGAITSSALVDFQIDENIPTTGVVDSKTREAFNELLLSELCPEGTGEDVDLLYPINKVNEVSSDFIPDNLTVLPDYVHPKGIICLKDFASESYIKMFDDAKKENITLGITSGFRKYEIQDYLFNLYTETMGLAEASRVSALPGHSEHQLGTTMDLTGSSIGFASTSKLMSSNIEGNWLEENAHKYGFVMSYPEGKESITGYSYEPWHYRYVGVDVAEAVKDSGLTLGEYLEK
ncbi:MAG: D-alanyl-D-alanine carboxypeptidase family protein [Candidatus Pacebacteria bacterium]|nr:D-alanyl-D-alanine carboxypeptidase family protein [Candidatus Paceibacterota bacterium]MBP9772960.1 D-alanyl-D-alanine carboxypeptidase family protein [Candidatus Paceibacterota bacterium]